MKKLLGRIVSIVAISFCSVASPAQSPSDAAKEGPKDHGTLIKEQPRADKPKRAAHGPKATVALQVIFSSSGKVVVLRVLGVTPKDLPKAVSDDLVKKSIKAVRQIKFDPAIKDGRPVSQFARIEYNFGAYDEEGKEK